jgi:hypothetical protein
MLSTNQAVAMIAKMPPLIGRQRQPFEAGCDIGDLGGLRAVLPVFALPLHHRRRCQFHGSSPWAFPQN